MPDPTETYQVTKEQLERFYHAGGAYIEREETFSEIFDKLCTTIGIKPIAKVDPVEGTLNPYSPTARWVTAHDPYKQPESIIESAGLETVYIDLKNSQPETPRLDLKEIERLYEQREDLMATVSNFGGSISLNQEQLYVLRNTPEDHRQHLKYAPQKFK